METSVALFLNHSCFSWLTFLFIYIFIYFSIIIFYMVFITLDGISHTQGHIIFLLLILSMTFITFVLFLFFLLLLPLSSPSSPASPGRNWSAITLWKSWPLEAFRVFNLQTRAGLCQGRHGERTVFFGVILSFYFVLCCKNTCEMFINTWLMFSE